MAGWLNAGAGASVQVHRSHEQRLARLVSGALECVCLLRTSDQHLRETATLGGAVHRAAPLRSLCQR